MCDFLWLTFSVLLHFKKYPAVFYIFNDVCIMSQFVIYSCIKMHTLENLATVKTELVRNYWLETNFVLALWPQTQYCNLFKF